MQNSEVTRSNTHRQVFVDYKPAELKLNKEWIIVYYSKNPRTNRLERMRLRVPTMDSKTARLKHAKRIVVEINIKLANGWSPFLEETERNFKTLEKCISEFLANIKKQIADNVLRPDTLRTYNSNLNLINQYISEKKLKILFGVEINKRFCFNYLDWIYLERESSPRTRNNHLGFLKLFSSFMIDKGILAENPTNGIRPLKPAKKKREVFPSEIKKVIANQLKTQNPHFFTLCMTTYFCFIRNTELRKLKTWMIDIEKSSIFLPKEISKNKKDESVTIPSQFLENLKQHIKDMPDSFYVFSSDKYKPGIKEMPVRKIQNGWDIVKKQLELPSKYQFYSLKDTGITDLLNSGVPVIRVRDQARHYDLKTTEMYTARSSSSDIVIQDAKILFS
jgi:integrase/recombinase XerD